MVCVRKPEVVGRGYMESVGVKKEKLWVIEVEFWDIKSVEYMFKKGLCFGRCNDLKDLTNIVLKGGVGEYCVECLELSIVGSKGLTNIVWKMSRIG